MALGPIPLVTAGRDECGRIRYYPLPDVALRRVVALAGNEVSDEAIECCVDGIGQVAVALNAGEDWRARLIAAQLRLPALTPAAMARLANLAALGKAGFNPGEPRASADSEGRPGEWTFEIPAYRAQVFAKQKRIWDRFHKAARTLKGQSSAQSFAYGETFAGEGGMTRAANGRRAGINDDLLEEARDAKDASKKNPLLPSLSRTMTPDQLTPEQAALIYRYYARDAFHTVGGSAALDNVGNRYAAAALFDTMFWQGRGSGAKTIQQAINDVAGAGTVPEDSQMGPATLDAYAKLAQKPETRAELLDALARRRTKWASDNGQPDPARIEHFRYVGTRD